MSSVAPVVIATDLTDDARPALLRGSGHAEATNAPLVVCHVVLDVFRSHPLIPNPREASGVMVEADVIHRAAELVTEQVGAVLQRPVGDYRVVVTSGAPAEEIVRLAESEGASMIVVGAKPREGTERVLGHVAERVVRYAACPVLVAREGRATGKILVATDFSPGSLPALAIAKEIVAAASVEATLLHVAQRPSSFLSSALMPLGDAWIPPPAAALDELAALGARTLEDLSKQYGFSRFEQLEARSPADVIAERADELDAEMIVMGSRGLTGLARLVLGSVAEKVIRQSTRSVLVAR